MTISGIAGMTPDINVYRHGACGFWATMPNAAVARPAGIALGAELWLGLLAIAGGVLFGTILHRSAR